MRWLNSSFLVGTMVVGGGLWLLILSTAIEPGDANGRAIWRMSVGLYLIWGVIGFLTLRHFREQIANRWEKLPVRAGFGAFLLAVTLFLTEEVVTTLMTNLAPVLGGEFGKAYITGSANYFEVILWHSGIAIIPVLAVWCAWISVFRVHPNVAYLAFGSMGVLAEVLYGGPGHVIAFAFWTTVYGPILYLPAYVLYRRESRKLFKIWHVPILWVLSMLSVIPSMLVVHHFRPADAGFPQALQESEIAISP